MNDSHVTPDDLLQPVLEQIQRNDDQALDALDRLVDRFDLDPRLHFLRGSVLCAIERYSEARLAMEKAVGLAPEFDLARFQLGFLELTSGDVTAAQSTWLPLMNLPADEPLKLFVLGLNKMVIDEFDAAITLLEEGISRNTVLPPLNGNMSLLVEEMKAKRTTPVSDGESDANFLLRQYAFKDTKH
jgi:tetratricopeptide (TPR) repeat protein